MEDRKARMEMVRRLHSHELDCQKKERLKKVKEKQTIVPKSLKRVSTDDDGDDKEVYKEVEKLENLIDLEEKLCCWSLKENAEHMEIDDLITSTGAGQEEMEVELMEEDAHEELDAIIRLMNDTWEEATYQEIKVAECRITKQETIEESMDTTTRDTDMVEEEDGVKYEEWVLKDLRVMGLDLMASYYNNKDAYNRGGSWIIDRWVDTNPPPAVTKSHGKNNLCRSVCSVRTNCTDTVCSNPGGNSTSITSGYYNCHSNNFTRKRKRLPGSRTSTSSTPPSSRSIWSTSLERRRMARGRRRISTHIARESTDSIVTNHVEGGLADQGGQGGDGHVRDRDAAADRQADRQGDEGGRDEGAGRGQGQDNPSWVDGQSKPLRQQPVPWKVTKRRHNSA